MSRAMPIECEHGNVIDWGDFGPPVARPPCSCDDAPPLDSPLTYTVTRDEWGGWMVECEPTGSALSGPTLDGVLGYLTDDAACYEENNR